MNSEAKNLFVQTKKITRKRKMKLLMKMMMDKKIKQEKRKKHNMVED
jgi:hypothetical protein